MSLNKIITRKTEVIETLTDAKEMQGKYLSEPLKRGWTEDFVDDDTGEVVSIERFEMIQERGLKIEGDVLSKILFHIECGDIKNVVCSNQERKGSIAFDNSSVWNVKASRPNGKSKLNLILIAQSLQQAIEISKDFIELKHEGSFVFNQVTAYKNAVIIEREVSEEELEEFDFYELQVLIEAEDISHYSTFVVLASDADNAKAIIENYLFEDENFKPVLYSLKVTLEAAKRIPVNSVIEKDFSLAYINE